MVDELLQLIPPKALPLWRAMVDQHRDTEWATKLFRAHRIDIFELLGNDWHEQLKAQLPHFVTIANRKAHDFVPASNDRYVGRGSPLGNPYTHFPVEKTLAKFQCATRDESIRLYGKYLRAEAAKKKPSPIKTEMTKIYRMALNGGVRLVCYCKPEPYDDCHGDHIKSLIHEKMIQRAHTSDFA